MRQQFIVYGCVYYKGSNDGSGLFEVVFYQVVQVVYIVVVGVGEVGYGVLNKLEIWNVYGIKCQVIGIIGIGQCESVCFKVFERFQLGMEDRVNGLIVLQINVVDFVGVIVKIVVSRYFFLSWFD